MILSIIIPMYNVGHFIEKCIRSCEIQDLSSNNYEIIAVNDGSPDNSLEIAERLSNEFTNLHIISQTNRGLGGARNTGLSNAKGEYVWFIDSDDWIQENCLKGLMKKCVEKQLDALQICAANVCGDHVQRRQHRLNTDIKSGVEILRSGQFDYCVPFTIYRREYLLDNNLQMTEGIFGEDAEFTPRSYFFLQRVSSVNDIIYYVYQNPESITRTLNPKRSFDTITVIKSIYAFKNKYVYAKEDQRVFDNLISQSINFTIDNILLSEKSRQNEIDIQLYDIRYIFNSLLNGRIKYKLEYPFFRLFPHSCVLIYKFLKFFTR